MTEPRIHRITPTVRPDGGDLHVEDYATDLLRDVIGLLAADRGLWDDLVDVIAGPVVTRDRHKPDVGSRDDVFIADLLAALPASATAIRLHGPELERLAGDLNDIAAQQKPKAVKAA